MLSIAQNALDPAWYDAVEPRISRRRFDGRRLPNETLTSIGQTCARLGTSDRGGRLTVVHTAPDDMFTGLVGAYGGVKGAPSAVMFVGPMGADVELGYLGEAVLLEATLLGIDTCWVAGSFDRKRTSLLTELAPGESVRAVTPLGYAAEQKHVAEHVLRSMVSSHKRLDLEQIAPGTESWPEWAREAAKAVRLAPSGGNAQPWRLRMDDGALVVACKQDSPYWTWEFDCGIAMLHAELGALHAGVKGAWERLDAPDVAAFRPAG